VGKRKAETVQSDTIGNNPRSKLPFRAIHLVKDDFHTAGRGLWIIDMFML